MNKNKVKVESNVDVNTIGKYLVTYIATDESGNKTQASREVEVIDTIAPKFSLESEEDLDIKKFKDDIIERGQTYQLPKFKTDTRDGIEKIIKYIDDEKNTFDVNEIDTTVTGEYEVTLKSTDEAGNIGYSLKKVIVKDTTRPEIKLIGDTEVTIEEGKI